MKLKPCPFCGTGAEVIVTHNEEGKEFKIVGCPTKSMLCPNPRMVVYPDENGSYDYKYWNRRQYED